MKRKSLDWKGKAGAKTSLVISNVGKLGRMVSVQGSCVLSVCEHVEAGWVI